MPSPVSASSLDNLPNLVIAGVTKAGTSSLHYYLTQHGDIASADTKEVDHYASLVFGGELPTLEDYASHFRDAGQAQYRLDASPRYFTGGLPLIRQLDADLPDPRVIISLRDPVARMWSGFTYKHSRALLPEDAGFDEFLAACSAVAESGLGRDVEGDNFRTLATGRYVDFLSDWFAELGDRLRVVFFDDIVTRPTDVMGDLFSWLGVSAEVAASIDFEARNRTVNPRSRTVRSLAVWANTHAGGVLGPSTARRALRAAYLRLNTKETELTMTPAQRRELTAYYAPSVDALRELLSTHGYVSFPSWLSEQAA